MTAPPRDDGAPAFATTALPHLDEVARFARWLVRDSADADDLVQETYLKALRAWHTFRPGSDCRAWLFTICRNAHISRLRRGERVEVMDDPDLETLASVETFRRAVHVGMDNAFGSFDLRDDIQRELASLPDDFREVVALVDLNDMSYEDAARILAIPPGTLRSRLYRARRILQDRLLRHAQDRGFGPRPTITSERGDA